MDKITDEIMVMENSLKITQEALREAQVQIVEICEEVSLAHSASSTIEIQSSKASMTPMDESSTFGLKA